MSGISNQIDSSDDQKIAKNKQARRFFWLNQNETGLDPGISITAFGKSRWVAAYRFCGLGQAT
jgi:hypothetical protein